MKSHPRARRVPPLPLLLVCSMSGALWPAQAGAQPDRSHYQAVLEITCNLPNGNVMKSTGFVWFDADRVVTALHAVAGCTRTQVYSEYLKTSLPATLDKVDLEADLALLKLAERLAVTPLKHLSAEPDLRSDRYRVVGYPLGITRMDSDEAVFADGLQGGMITLKDAYDSVRSQRDLFAGVAFPKTSATVFRVKSLLQPGQSGAPILDSKGRVVAIVDGGMLDGWRGLNWSIPAHKYLPGLPNSKDAKPTRPSEWANLYSRVTPAEPKSIVIPARVQAGSPPAKGALQRVRTMTLAAFEQLLIRKGEPDSNITFIRQTLTPAEFDRLSFDIYEDPVTGATFGVPASIQLAWNPDITAVDARTASGKARMIIGILSSPSYADAKVSGRQAFLNPIVKLAQWKQSPATLALSREGDSVEYANNANFFHGVDRSTGQPVSLNLSLTVSGRQLLGYAVYGPDDIARDLSPQDLAAYLMMQMGAQNLSDFAAH